MRLRKSFEFFVMPFQWFARGCYDREAHVVAWKHCIAFLLLGRNWKFPKMERRVYDMEADRWTSLS